MLINQAQAIELASTEPGHALRNFRIDDGRTFRSRFRVGHPSSFQTLPHLTRKTARVSSNLGQNGHNRQHRKVKSDLSELALLPLVTIVLLLIGP